MNTPQEIFEPETYMKICKHNRQPRLTSGNCGLYAWALHELTGLGTVIALDDGWGYPHVLLLFNGRYYDGVTIFENWEALANDSWWGDSVADSKPKIIDHLELIIENTMCPHTYHDVKTNLEKAIQEVLE